MKKRDTLLLVLLAVILALIAVPGTAQARLGPELGAEGRSDFSQPAPVSASPTADSDQPLYFFLFTHTEDPFNYDLSEERYTRFVPEVRVRAASHPDANLTWTIMFQGTDARSVAERNPQTGVLDLLRVAHAEGVVHFGYHAHHEATYSNRPQNSFSEQSSWQDLTNGMVDWLGCLKDVKYGGCLAPDGGGINAVQQYFGPVEAVSGAYQQADTAYEGGPTSHAARYWLSDRLVGFGYPDHGPFGSGERRDAVAALMQRLTPTQETSSTVFWADNVIKMTGGSPIDGTRGIDPLRGPQFAQGMLAGLDRTRPNVVLTGLASKYHYTKQIPQNSPTIYGYAHPESPQLPANLLNTPQEKEGFYQQSLNTLDYLLDDVLPNNPGSRFIDSADVENMVAPPAYWSLSPAQIDALARWALDNWTDRPPDWVSDGADFYSLRDLFTLLTAALAAGDVNASAATFNLPTAYGPLAVVDAAGTISLSRAQIVALAQSLAPHFAPNQPWQTTPNALIQPTYTSPSGDLTAAQLLYGMASVYTADYDGAPVQNLTLPATGAMPATYDLLRQIGCLATCSGTAWSFKPARLSAPPPSPPAEHTLFLPQILARQTATASQPEAYVLFAINVQDFSYPDRSAAALADIVTLHEQTGVPVDIYLTDDIARLYAAANPDLLARLRRSPVVAISYHARPPRPYAGYDWLGLKNLSAGDLYDTIYRYETHAVNPVTGQTTDSAGGYRFVADLMGYSPYAASAISSSPGVLATTTQVFRDLGAQMTVSHSGSPALGDSQYGLPLRPEQAEFRLFEYDGTDAGAGFEAALSRAQANRAGAAPVFVGVKIHDNDFFAEQSAWVTVYVQDRRRPNWDPTLKAPLLPAAEQAAMWALYEATVRYVAAQGDRLAPVNIPAVLEMAPG